MPGRNSGNSRATLYQRDSGAICFKVQLRGPSGVSPGAFVEGLLASDLEWLWLSEIPSRDPDHPGSIAARTLTQLTNSTAQDLIADLSEIDDYGCGRFVAMHAVKNVPERAEIGWLRQVLREFSRGIEGELQMVVVHIGDTFDDYVYVLRDQSDAAARVLDEWGLGGSSSSSFHEKKYRALRTASLEHLFDLDTPAK